MLPMAYQGDLKGFDPSLFKGTKSDFVSMYRKRKMKMALIKNKRPLNFKNLNSYCVTRH